MYYLVINYLNIYSGGFTVHANNTMFSLIKIKKYVLLKNE